MDEREGVFVFCCRALMLCTGDKARLVAGHGVRSLRQPPVCCVAAPASAGSADALSERPARWAASVLEKGTSG